MPILFILLFCSYLSSHTAPTPRFTTWFGAYQHTSRNVVLENFNSLLSREDAFTGWKYDCSLPDSCDHDDFAFVDPNVLSVNLSDLASPVLFISHSIDMVSSIFAGDSSQHRLLGPTQRYEWNILSIVQNYSVVL